MDQVATGWRCRAGAAEEELRQVGQQGEPVGRQPRARGCHNEQHQPLRCLAQGLAVAQRQGSATLLRAWGVSSRLRLCRLLLRLLRSRPA